MVVRTPKNWRTSSNARQKRDAEAKLPKVAHGIVALLDPAVILLQSIVEGGVAPMGDVTAKDLADRTRGRIMPIGRHLFWRVTNYIDGLFEKALGRLHVSLPTHHRVNQVAIPIDGSIEIAAISFDIDIRFIDVPRPVLATWYICSGKAILRAIERAFTGCK